jgi:uncharacterized protein (DUF488 family)
VAAPAVWTIGHSNHPFERFAALLAGDAIDVVADVRSYPQSRFAPQFGRQRLAEALAERGVEYRFLGEALGGRPADAELYDAEGHALYDRMSESPAFQAAIEALAADAATRRIALLCSERDPDGCHRRLLVAKVLADRGVELRHLLPDGGVRVEQAVTVDDGAQASLLGGDAGGWRSPQPVAHRRRPDRA